mmetsp:Transcript_20362/g.37786  ORF Transcript_20362/g.37786 Transcript_20362/m.37786 type:complete len:331 (-) Transcript_20362:218-1210(-)
MSGDSVDAAVLEMTLKSGHSSCLDGHFQSVPHRVHPKSQMLSKVRSIPKIPVDTSYDAVQESVNRTLLHQLVHSSNPKVFRRGGDPDSNFSRFNSSKHIVRNLLPDMHPVSDKKDICPPKFGYNFSKIKRSEPELRTSIEDFLQPKDQTHERKIGYNPGHIRTILQLDTFGPAHSEVVSEGRASGKLPMSPNLDRNRSPASSKVDDASSGFWGGDELSVGSPGSTRSPPRSPHPKTQVLFGGTWNKDLLDATLNDKTQPLVRPSTSGYNQDARGTNQDYSKHRTQMLKDKQAMKEKRESMRKDKSRQKKESEEYQTLINEFEAHLKSIQY